MRKALVVLACLFSNALPAYVQPRAADPVDAMVRRLERVLNDGDKAAFPSLFDPSVSGDSITQHEYDLFFRGAVRTVLFERSRGPLEGAPVGDGFRVVVEMFMETPGRARIVTAGLDIRRPPGGDAASWRISSIDSMSAIDGLHKLRLNTKTPLAVRNLELRSEDAIVAMQDGLLFRVECDDGVTGMVLVGRGELRFSPASATERGQLRIFAGTESLSAPFETAFVRINPNDYAEQVATATLSDSTSDVRMARRAQDVFNRQVTKSFGVDVGDMSRDSWHLLPAADDFLAEVDTRRFDTLTYLRSSQQAEDVSLFRRDDRKTITAVPLGGETGGARAFLQRRLVARIRRARLRGHGVHRPPAPVHPRSGPPLGPRPLHGAVDDARAARGFTGGHGGIERRVRAAASAAPRRPEHDRRQPAARAAAGFGSHARDRVRRTDRIAESRRRHGAEHCAS